MNNVIKLNGGWPTDMENKQTMDRLKLAREKAGLTAAQLAKKVGMNAAAYRRYERGEVSPKLDLCKAIANALDMRLGELFDDDYNPPAEVDLVGRARPGQTIYIKIVVDEEGRIAPPPA